MSIYKIKYQHKKRGHKRKPPKWPKSKNGDSRRTSPYHTEEQYVRKSIKESLCDIIYEYGLHLDTDTLEITKIHVSINSFCIDMIELLKSL